MFYTEDYVGITYVFHLRRGGTRNLLLYAVSKIVV